MWGILLSVVGIIGVIFTFLVPLFPPDYQDIVRYLALGVIAVALIAGGGYFVFLRIRLGPLIRLRRKSDAGMLFMGRIPNTSLRVKTIQVMLSSLASQCEDYETVLKKAGQRVGQSFGRDLLTELRSEGTSPTEKELLNFWRKYDSNAGLGKFNFESFDLETRTGEITINNSFLAFNGNEMDNRLCAFTEGYIEGTLSQLLDTRVTAESNCPTLPHHSICRFVIRRQD